MIIRGLRPRITAPFERFEEETVPVEIAPGGEELDGAGRADHASATCSPPRLVIIADALAKSTALARDEREVSKVFEVIEPFAAQLATSGRSPTNLSTDAADDRAGTDRPAAHCRPHRGRGEA